MKERSAGIILHHGKRYLLLHYAEGHWDFPKGRIEAGETEKEAAVRETKEETGITRLQFNDRFREDLHYFYQRNGMTTAKSVVFFLAETPQEKVMLSDEHQGHAWLPFDEALQQLTFRNAKELLRKAASARATSS